MLERIFKITENNTTTKSEIIGGVTTFMTMVYILIVIPSISATTGMNQEALFTSTVISTVIGCFLMGFIANLPIALAPGLGINAFFAYTIVLQMGYSWETALAAIFIEGAIFVALSLLNIREMIVNAIPAVMRTAITVGIGLFITTIGLVNGGVIVQGGMLSSMSKLSSPELYLTLISIVIIGVLMIKKIQGAMLLGMAITTVVALIIGVVSIPDGFSPIALPHSIEPVFMKMDFSQLLSIDMLVILFTLVFTDMFDTAGNLIAICRRPNMVNEKGEIKSLNRAFLSDAIATMTGAIFGSSTITSYTESATGVIAGGRTGLTAIVTGALFLMAMFLAPLFSLVPMAATSAVLIIVGLFVASEIRNVEFDNYIDSIPAFLTIILIPLSCNIANGIIFGFLSYIFLRLLLGRYKEVSGMMYILMILFILKIIVL